MATPTGGATGRGSPTASPGRSGIVALMPVKAYRWGGIVLLAWTGAVLVSTQKRWSIGSGSLLIEEDAASLLPPSWHQLQLNEAAVPSWQEEDDDDDAVCKLPQEFKSRPSPFTCNILHEMSLDPTNIVQILGCGSHFCIFELQDSLGNSVAFKTPRVDGSRHEWPDEYLPRVRTETLIMDQLSSSPFILGLFANCGQAKIVPKGSHGCLYDQFLLRRTNRQDVFSPETRLRIGYQLVQAVVDLHGPGPIPRMFHNDLCHSQFIFINGVYKLNDFDLANMTYFDEEGIPCKEVPVDMGSDWIKDRAPEELPYPSTVPVMRYKLDVWSLGNVLFNTLTRRNPFSNFKTNVVQKALLQGKTTAFPDEFYDSEHIEDHAMVTAIRMAWTHDPDERPTAQQIADVLHDALVEIGSKPDKDGVYRVSIPPLPKGYEFDLHSDDNY